MINSPCKPKSSFHILLHLTHIFLISLLLPDALQAQANTWTWIKGTSNPYEYPVYGTQGIPSPANNPGTRAGSLSWTDNDGNFWLFGGYGRTSATSGSDYLNDLWKYDSLTNQWTWIKGSNVLNQVGIYGTMGIPAPENTPGSRVDSVAWTDSNGNLWLFGGSGYAASGRGYLNDLWKYDPTNNQWTWVKGSNIRNQRGIYGTMGTPETENAPGSRTGSVSWTDQSGNFWLFGGEGYDASEDGPLNDLWKYDPANNLWTWVKGNNINSQRGIYGIMGTPAPENTPGSRYESVSWTDNNGNFWLFGGNGYAASWRGYLNDLWKYDPANNQWTWVKGGNAPDQNGVYGTIGIPATENTPGSLAGSISWTDQNNTLWLFGGGTSNALWKYVLATNQWTWMKGSNAPLPDDIYGTMGVPAIENTPGSRQDSVSWIDKNGNLWLFGGRSLNDLWKYSPVSNQWTWIKGGNASLPSAIYGTAEVPTAENTPGSRYGSVSWIDNDGNAWLFGGNSLNDLWRYDPSINQWSWVKGSNTVNQNGIYGNQGTPAVENTPGSRNSSISWIDNSGNLWLFGGNGLAASGSGFLNDLWKYNPITNQWTWIKGSNTINQNGVYGNQGIPAPENTPGSRWGSVSWTDNSGNLWLFGGHAYYSSGFETNLNDLWKYDPTNNQWTWIKGSNSGPQSGTYGTYGTQGIPAAENTPGSRYGSTSWTDKTGNLWIFGGFGNAISEVGNLNDLWKYNPTNNQWTWINGGNAPDQYGIYGILGIPAVENTPGSRQDSAAWTDNTGNFWLFGGRGFAGLRSGSLNDLWKYNPATNQWTWIKGSNLPYQNGIYGTLGIPAAENTPGARSSSVSWTDNAGNFWLFGSSQLDDLWKFTPDNNSSINWDQAILY